MPHQSVALQLKQTGQNVFLHILPCLFFILIKFLFDFPHSILLSACK